MYPSFENYECFRRNKSHLEVLNLISASDGYFPSFYSIPKAQNASDIVIGAMRTNRYSLQLPPGSIIVGLTGYSSMQDGFTTTITDNGSKLTTGLKIHSSALGSWNNPSSPFPIDVPSGIKYFEQPIIVLSPGQISIEITNLSSSSNSIQIVFHAFVPATQRNLGTLGVN